MLPVNLLGDAAAAESMVQQATRSQRSDQRTNNEIFERYLYLNREISRLNSVHPTDETQGKNRIEEEYHDENFLEENPKHRRQTSFSFQSLMQSPEIVPDVQPMLFDIHMDRVASTYHQMEESMDRGNKIDRKA